MWAQRTSPQEKPLSAYMFCLQPCPQPRQQQQQQQQQRQQQQQHKQQQPQQQSTAVRAHSDFQDTLPKKINVVIAGYAGPGVL